MSHKSGFSIKKYAKHLKAFRILSPRLGHTSSKVLNVILLMLFVGSLTYLAGATAPNPGHNFVEVGGGAVQGDILYGSSADTLSALAKNTSATRYISNTGTSNNPAWAQIDLANGVTGTLPGGNGGTGNAFTLFSGPTTSLKTFTLPDASSTILTDNTAVTVAQGGTGLGTLTANNVILGNGTSAPTFVAPGADNNVLTSNGTTWVSEAPAGGSTPIIHTVVTRPIMATGAVLTTQTFTTVLTARKAGLFNVPGEITVNQISFNAVVGGTSPSYTMKVCIYDELGTTKLIDLTSGTINSTGVKSLTVSPAVTLSPGNYYVVYGPATQSGTSPTIAFSNFTSTAATWVNTSAVPTGKLKYEGTLTMASGVCDSTMGTITGTVSQTPVMRLDN